MAALLALNVPVFLFGSLLDDVLSVGMPNALAKWMYLGFHAALLLVFLGGFLSWGTITAGLRALSLKGRVGFGVLVVVALGLSVFHVPRTNRIFYDEHIYQAIGQHMARENKAFLCNHCDLRRGDYRPLATEYNKQPAAYPFVLSLFYRVFGVHEWVAHGVNHLALLLGIFAIHGLVFGMFQCQAPAFLASAFFAATPMVLVWSNTAAVEVSTAAFAALAIFATASLAALPSLGSFLFSLGNCALAFQFRPEAILLTLPAGLLLALSQKGTWRSRIASIVAWGLSLGLLCIPLLVHLYFVRDHEWGSAKAKFSLDYFAGNFQSNGAYFVDDRLYPIMLTFFGILGVFQVRYWRKSLPIVVWGVLMWGIFLFFYAGSYSYGADLRFAVLSAAPMAILAGLGAWQFVIALRPVNLSPALCWGIVAVALSVGWVKFLPLTSKVGEEAFQARADVRFAREFVKEVPPDAVVIGHSPALWNVLGRSAIQSFMMLDDSDVLRRQLFDQYRGGVFFHWNFWCNTADPVQTAVCEAVLARNKTKLIREVRYEGQRFALFRLEVPKSQ